MPKRDARVILLPLPASERVPPLIFRLITRWRRVRSARSAGIMVFETENHPETRSTQRTLPRNDPDRIQVAFDDHHLVSDAGLMLPVTMAHRLEPGELVDNFVEPERVDKLAGPSPLVHQPSV